MATEYLDRKDAVITKERWKELRDDPVYKSVRRYDNGKVHVEIEWYGKVPNPAGTWESLKKVFKFTASNYTVEGKLVPDGANGEVWFRTEEAAVEHYEKFLADWTESQIVAGKFVEEGNTLKTLDPDLPESEIVIPGFEGGAAW
jgi:hypothetical protein